MEIILNNLVKNKIFDTSANYTEPKFPVHLDEKIHNSIAIPFLEESGAIKKESNPRPLENRVDADVSAPKPLLERIDEELERMDHMLQDPLRDPALILQQAYRIIGLLQRRTAQTEKLHVLDTEPALWENIQKLKGSYNAWDVLATALLSGVLTGAGGFTTIASVLPGTTAGQSLATAFPDIFQFFANANNAKTLASVGDGIKGVGQGSEVFQRVFSNGDESKRVVLNYLIENTKRNQSDWQDAYRGARDHFHSANNNGNNVGETLHRAIEALLKATTG